MNVLTCIPSTRLPLMVSCCICIGWVLTNDVSLLQTARTSNCTMHVPVLYLSIMPSAWRLFLGFGSVSRCDCVTQYSCYSDNAVSDGASSSMVVSCIHNKCSHCCNCMTLQKPLARLVALARICRSRCLYSATVSFFQYLCVACHKLPYLVISRMGCVQ